MRWCLAIALALACAIGDGVAVAASTRAAKTLRVTAGSVTDTSFDSSALRSAVHFLIYLPPDYATSATRYPVVYFLHGLPAGPTSYKSVAWVAAAVEQTGRHAIVVIPQGTRRAHGDPEYHDWGRGQNWATALAVELPRYVDANYRTIATRAGRAIVGVSAGGYGATILAFQHPTEFAAVESWSGYFRPTDPTGQHTLDVGSPADNKRANLHEEIPELKRRFSRYPTFLAFYVGLADPTFVPSNLLLNRELTDAGVAHVFREYPGAHSNALWQAHAVPWLTLALDHLAPPTG
jgi:putative tributyrin esterase